MRLLFDQNLSPYLPERLSDAYPDSQHVMDAGLERAMDEEIWDYAKREDLVIVTKDADFSEWSLLRGSPPNVVWIRRGNCSTQEIEQVLYRFRTFDVQFSVVSRQASFAGFGFQTYV